jgi:hypothetical protein
LLGQLKTFSGPPLVQQASSALSTLREYTIIMSSLKRPGSHGDDGTPGGKKPRKKNDNDNSFDYDSDEDLPEESIKSRLSWRNDDDPFADWKIVIINTGSSEEITYKMFASVFSQMVLAEVNTLFDSLEMKEISPKRRTKPAV